MDWKRRLNANVADATSVILPDTIYVGTLLLHFKYIFLGIALHILIKPALFMELLTSKTSFECIAKVKPTQNVF